MNQLSYSFDWRRDEHARVVSLLVRELFSSGFRRLLKWIVISVLVLEGIYVVVMVGLGDLETVVVLIVLLVIVVPMVAGFYRITGTIRAWQVGRSDPNVHSPVVHRLDDAGYHIVTHTATIDLKWDGLYKVRETDEFFLIYYSRQYAYYLPKRVLSGPEECETVRGTIHHRLQGEVEYEQG